MKIGLLSGLLILALGSGGIHAAEIVKVNAGASIYSSPNHVGQRFKLPAANDRQMLVKFRFLDGDAANSAPGSGVLYLFEHAYAGTPANLASADAISVGAYDASFGGWIFNPAPPLTGGATYYVYTSAVFSGGFGFGYGYSDGALFFSYGNTELYSSGLGGASANFELTLAPDTEPPVVTISGKKKITTSKPKLKIKGTAMDAVGVERVEVKVGKKPFKPAAGTAEWRYTAKLKPGANKIKIRAVDTLGNTSTPLKLTARRL